MEVPLYIANSRARAQMARKKNIQRITFTLILLVFTILIILPFLWLLQMSIKTTQEILLNPYAMPESVRWQNYLQLFTDPRVNIQQYFKNSIIVTGGALLASTLLATMGGYGFGRRRYQFRGRTILLSVLLFALMLPPQVMYIPQFTLMSKYGLLNTYWALIFLYTAMSLPMSTYLMSTYFSQLPGELEDAARIDGCSDWMMFWKIMLPIARPAVLTILLLNFLHFWNELLLAITMITNPAMRTLPAAIFHFVGETRSEIGMAASSLIVAMLPVLIFYLFFSEKFVEGLTAGAIKG